jgi:crotonobetainyl-CoA:carnitine CoA-transferase CaiB-like acyl-CoA transferase
MCVLAAAKIPAGRINKVNEALNSDQAAARDLVQTYETDQGVIRVVRHPVVAPGLFAETTSPPAMGEGGDALLDRWLSQPSKEKTTQKAKVQVE